MNKDKVYLKDYVIGRAADTLGYHGLMVQLENLDIVEIDKNLVHKEIGESQKPVVLQFVADWYEEHKDDFDYNLWEYLTDWEEQEPSDFKNWINDEYNTFQTLVNMHQFGYTVEKEKRYLVKIKDVEGDNCYLNRVMSKWIIAGSDDHPVLDIYTHHTRKELEQSGFGWVFDCPGIEIEEVKE